MGLDQVSLVWRVKFQVKCILQSHKPYLNHSKSQNSLSTIFLCMAMIRGFIYFYFWFFALFIILKHIIIAISSLTKCQIEVVVVMTDVSCRISKTRITWQFSRMGVLLDWLLKDDRVLHNLGCVIRATLLRVLWESSHYRFVTHRCKTLSICLETIIFFYSSHVVFRSEHFKNLLTKFSLIS